MGVGTPVEHLEDIAAPYHYRTPRSPSRSHNKSFLANPPQGTESWELQKFNQYGDGKLPLYAASQGGYRSAARVDAFWLLERIPSHVLYRCHGAVLSIIVNIVLATH